MKRTKTICIKKDFNSGDHKIHVTECYASEAIKQNLR